MNSDRWKAKDFEFHFAYNARYKISKRLLQVLLFAAQILAINPKKMASTKSNKISISWSNPIILLLTPKESLYNSQIVVKFMNKKLIYNDYRQDNTSSQNLS